jgi:hypothetical protein
MSGDILVVARNQKGLYEYLRNDFAGDPEVKVVMDRRIGERRREAQEWKTERRNGDRRERPALDEKLESIGFAVVRVD